MYPITLGYLIDMLNSFKQKYKESPLKIIEYGEDMDWSIKHNIGEFYSWRGDSNQLTVPPGSNEYTVSSFLDMLEDEVLNKTFFGYKGGNFIMSKDVLIWADAHGRVDDMGIIDVKMDDNDIVLVMVQCSS